MKKIKKFRKNQFDRPEQNVSKKKRRKASLKLQPRDDDQWSKQHFRDYLEEE